MLKHVLLKQVKDGALALPESTDLIQTTDDGVKIYDLVAPEGYTCLGSIAVKKGEDPDITRYCCPKNEYLIEAEERPIYKWSDTAIYTSTRSSPAGVIASTFKATKVTPENKKTWTPADTSVATFNAYGGNYNGFPASNLNKKGGMWISKNDSGARGITVKFAKEVTISRFSDQCSKF